MLNLKMLLLSWFTSKNCISIPVVTVPCSFWKLKWVKKTVLGKQCLKIRLSIRGCPSSSCLAIKYFQQYFKMVLHSKCGSGLNKEIHHLRTFSFPTYRALKRLHCFAILWSTLPQNPKATADDQPALHKSLWLYTRTSGWFTNGRAGLRPHFKYI